MFNPFKKNDCLQFCKKHWMKLAIAQALVIFAAGAFFANSYFPPTMKIQPSNDQVDGSMEGMDMAGHDHGSTDSKPEWWTCAMHPQIRKREPGDCPICQMKLVPVKASSGGLRTLTIKPSVKELLKIETSPVERRYVDAEIRMVGKVEYDETKLAQITARVSGRLDRLYVDYTGVKVNQNDHMAYIYSEQLYSAQQELIEAAKFKRENPSRRGSRLDLVGAAREKLRLLGLTEQQVDAIAQQSEPEDHITLYSPMSGIVVMKMKNEGDRVKTGDRIYTIADLNQVWVKMDAYESDLMWIRYGQQVSFETEAYPGEQFTGMISFVDPMLNESTRTIKVRVNVDNRDGKLKPGMFVRAVVNSKVAAGGRVLSPNLAGKWISPMHPEVVKDQPGNCDVCGMPLVRAESLGYVSASEDTSHKPLVIPKTAALVTGTRAIVYVQVDGAKEPTYEGREVLLGPRAGDYYIVRNGLNEGEQVVTHGNFKIDSALQIQAKPTMMTPQGGGGGGMHNHADMGGGDSKDDGQMKPMNMSMELPEGFLSQLHDLISQSQEVSAAVASRDINEARESYQRLQRSVSRVNAQGLTDQPAMLWKEYLMLLGNDAMEGAQANDLPTMQRVSDVLATHIKLMSGKFMLQHNEHSMGQHQTGSPSTPVIADNVPSEFKNQLTTALNAYYELQIALAADDTDSVPQAIANVENTFSQIADSALDESLSATWAIEKPHFTTIINQLNSAENIAEARAAFALLSDQLLVAVKQFGVVNTSKVYKLHCPMAFDGRGATWLQPNDNTQNPYFGQSMLKCADKVQLIQSK